MTTTNEGQVYALWEPSSSGTKLGLSCVEPLGRTFAYQFSSAVTPDSKHRGRGGRCYFGVTRNKKLSHREIPMGAWVASRIKEMPSTDKKVHVTPKTTVPRSAKKAARANTTDVIRAQYSAFSGAVYVFRCSQRGRPDLDASGRRPMSTTERKASQVIDYNRFFSARPVGKDIKKSKLDPMILFI